MPPADDSRIDGFSLSRFFSGQRNRQSQHREYTPAHHAADSNGQSVLKTDFSVHFSYHPDTELPVALLFYQSFSTTFKLAASSLPSLFLLHHPHHLHHCSLPLQPKTRPGRPGPSDLIVLIVAFLPIVRISSPAETGIFGGFVGRRMGSGG
jgi:hypothetical protein